MSNEHILACNFIHRQAARQHTAPDVGDSCQFQQPLHCAVLTEGTVQNREDYIDRWESLSCCTRHQFTPGDGRLLLGRIRMDGNVAQQSIWIVTQQPTAITCDADRNDLTSPLLQNRHHGAGRSKRDIVLARLSTEDHRYAFSVVYHT